MNKLEKLQKNIKGLEYCTYDWGVYRTHQNRDNIRSRLETENIPVEWLDAKRLPPSQVHRLRCFLQKYYPGVSW